MKLALNTEVPQGRVKGGRGKSMKDNLCLNKEGVWGWSAQSTAGEAAGRAELLGTSGHKREWSQSKFQKGRTARGRVGWTVPHSLAPWRDH